MIQESLLDPAAFAVLFDRHYERIWRYVCRRAGATNLLRGHRRAEARRMRAHARAAEPTETHGGLDGIEQRVDAAARAPGVAAALGSLKPADRDAVLLLVCEVAIEG